MKRLRHEEARVYGKLLGEATMTEDDGAIRVRVTLYEHSGGGTAAGISDTMGGTVDASDHSGAETLWVTALTEVQQLFVGRVLDEPLTENAVAAELVRLEEEGHDVSQIVVGDVKTELIARRIFHSSGVNGTAFRPSSIAVRINYTLKAGTWSLV